MDSLFSGVEFLLRGGLMMIPLLLSGLFALSILIERLWMFRYHYHTPTSDLEQVFQLLKKQDYTGAQVLCEADQKRTPARSVLLAGTSHIRHSSEEMELSMKNQAEAWLPLLERRIEWIDTVITAAPLLGLLGTITGMMASFQVLSSKGVNEPNAITGGVAEALIATATGLVIALICLVGYNLLTARVRAFVSEMETLGSRLLEIRLAHLRQNASVLPVPTGLTRTPAEPSPETNLESPSPSHLRAPVTSSLSETANSFSA
jgi:biopolymer transport protein ExbB